MLNENADKFFYRESPLYFRGDLLTGVQRQIADLLTFLAKFDEIHEIPEKSSKNPPLDSRGGVDIVYGLQGTILEKLNCYKLLRSYSVHI